MGSRWEQYGQLDGNRVGSERKGFFVFLAGGTLWTCNVVLFCTVPYLLETGGLEVDADRGSARLDINEQTPPAAAMRMPQTGIPGGSDADP
jgi:hypothetical protein